MSFLDFITVSSSGNNQSNQKQKEKLGIAEIDFPRKVSQLQRFHRKNFYGNKHKLGIFLKLTLLLINMSAFGKCTDDCLPLWSSLWPSCRRAVWCARLVSYFHALSMPRLACPCWHPPAPVKTKQSQTYIQVNLDMTDHCTTDFCIWRTICLVPESDAYQVIHMYTSDFAYDGPIFLVPLSPSYPSSPVHIYQQSC